MTVPSTGRMFWLGFGAVVGLGLILRLRTGSFWTDVRDGMRERESELRTALGVGGEPAGSTDSVSDSERR